MSSRARIAPVVALSLSALSSAPAAAQGRRATARVRAAAARATGAVASATIGRGIQTAFRLAAALKSDRVFHLPGDAVYGGSIQLTEQGRALGLASGAVRLRPSRGIKKQGATILGIALKLPTADGSRTEDVNVISAREKNGSDRPDTRPSGFFDAAHFSSVLPHQVGGQKMLIRLRPIERVRGPSNPGDLGQFAERALAGKADFTLIARPARGDEIVLGTVSLRGAPPSADAAAFRSDMFANRALPPAGAVNWIRRFAYRGSQQGRGAVD